MKTPNTTNASSSVSLCMIVRNEGDQLAKCLEPIAGLFSEIVIVDTGSQDETREVAQRFTDRVFDFAWCDDFSAARNEALRRARGEWIFWIDADDRLLPTDVEKLRRVLAGLSDRPQAYLLETVLKQTADSRDRERIATHLRLFRRHPALKWHRRIHEQLLPWPTALGYELVFTDIRIQHEGYADAGLLQRKLRRNVRLLRMEFALSPDDPCVMIDLGEAYAQLGKPAETRQFLRAVLQSSRGTPYLRRRAFTSLGELDNAEGNFAAGDRLLATALREFPGDDYLLYMHSEALYNLDRHAEAKAALLKILNQPPEANKLQIGVPSDLRRRLARLALAEVLRVDLDLREAEKLLVTVTEDSPGDALAWYFLGRVYCDGRDWQKLGQVVDRLQLLEQGCVFALLLTAAAQLARTQYYDAEQTLDRLIPDVPYMVLPRVLRAESLERRRAPVLTRMQACRDVLRIQPHNPRALSLLRKLESPQPAARANDWTSLCTSVVMGAGVPGGESVVSSGY